MSDNWVRFTIETGDGEKEVLDVPSSVSGKRLRNQERFTEMKNLAIHVADVFCSKKGPAVKVFDKNNMIMLTENKITISVHGKNETEIKTVIDAIVPVLEKITDMPDVNIYQEVLQ